MTHPITVERRTLAQIAETTPLTAHHLRDHGYVARVLLTTIETGPATEAWESTKGTLYYIAGSKRLLERYFREHPEVQP